jgi:predicted dehydrogenase
VLKRIGISIVGLGRVSQAHIDSIRLNPETTQLAAVVDINESLAKETAKKYNTKYYTNIEDALADPDIQGMVICLPHYLHNPITLQALETGRHVLVEKPLAINYAEAKSIIDKAREKGVVLMVGQCYRFMVGFQEAKRRLRSEIGDPFNFVYNVNCGFNRQSAPPWCKSEKKTGGLAFLMVGSHGVDMTVWMYEGKKPMRVYAEALSKNPEFEGMDETVIVTTFDDASMATNHLSLNTNPERFDGYIVGSKGLMEFRHVRLEGAPGMFACELTANGKTIPTEEPRTHNFAFEMQEFAESILQKREPMVKNDEILTQFAIIDAAKKAAQTHCAVELDIPHFIS